MCRVFEGAANIRVEGNRLPIFLVALDRAVAQAKGEGRVGGLIEAVLREAGFGNDGAVAAHDGVYFVFELLANFASSWVDGSHDDDQGVGAGVDGGLSAFVQLLADGDVV